MKKQTIRINESKLRQIIKESVKKVLKESIEKTPIFTVNAFNITQDYGIDDMQITAKEYHSEDDAINAAIEGAKKYADLNGDVILFSVMGGEYQLPSGDVYGEPYELCCISNSDKEKTIAARKQVGYTKGEVDYYITIREGKFYLGDNHQRLFDRFSEPKASIHTTWGDHNYDI